MQCNETLLYKAKSKMLPQSFVLTRQAALKDDFWEFLYPYAGHAEVVSRLA